MHCGLHHHFQLLLVDVNKIYTTSFYPHVPKIVCMYKGPRIKDVEEVTRTLYEALSLHHLLQILLESSFTISEGKGIAGIINETASNWYE